MLGSTWPAKLVGWYVDSTHNSTSTKAAQQTYPRASHDACTHAHTTHPLLYKTSQAQLKTEIEAHTEAAKCKPVMDPKQGSWCPLCNALVKPGKEGWVAHFMKNGCPSNPRTPK